MLHVINIPLNHPRNKLDICLLVKTVLYIEPTKFSVIRPICENDQHNRCNKY